MDTSLLRVEHALMLSIPSEILFWEEPEQQRHAQLQLSLRAEDIFIIANVNRVRFIHHNYNHHNFHHQIWPGNDIKSIAW